MIGEPEMEGSHPTVSFKHPKKYFTTLGKRGKKIHVDMEDAILEYM